MGQVVVVDIKSKNLPAWGGQFDTYMLGLEHTYGVRADLSGGWLPTLKGRENGGIPFFRSRDDVDEQRLLLQADRECLRLAQWLETVTGGPLATEP